MSNNKPLTEQEKEAIIRKTATKKLMEEIEEHSRMSIDEEWEQPYTIVESFEWFSFVSDDDMWKNFRRPVMDVHIALGNYQPITDEEYENAYCSGDKRKSYPKHKGVRYEWVG